MNTYIVGKNADGADVNSDGEEVIACSTGCGRMTTMTGTQLCDPCWEAERKASREDMAARMAEHAQASAAH